MWDLVANAYQLLISADAIFNTMADVCVALHCVLHCDIVRTHCRFFLKFVLTSRQVVKSKIACSIQVISSVAVAKRISMPRPASHRYPWASAVCRAWSRDAHAPRLSKTLFLTLPWRPVCEWTLPARALVSAAHCVYCQQECAPPPHM